MFFAEEQKLIFLAFFSKDVINALVFSPFAGGPITMDHENTVKAYSASPSMLGRGHSLFEPQGPVWVGHFCRLLYAWGIDNHYLLCQSVHASDYHPQLAVGAADGSCSTTNLLRSTRRGGSVVRGFCVQLLFSAGADIHFIQPFFVHKIFQMDYSRNTKEYRMLDRFLPQVSLRPRKIQESSLNPLSQFIVFKGIFRSSNSNKSLQRQERQKR